MLSPASLNIAGILFNLVGVFLLFRFGMPYRVPSDGTAGWIALEGDAPVETLAADRRYKRWGWTGLCLIVLGAVFQILASVV